jgi:hypothetical protein
MLLPRVSLTGINSLSPLVPSATALDKEEHIGLMVYNLNETAPFLKGVYIWNGTTWEIYRQLSNITSSELSATNGLRKTGSDFVGLGGTGLVRPMTIINQADYDFKLTETTGAFTVNPNGSANALGVSGSNHNTGFGAAPTSTDKLTVKGNTTIKGDLVVQSSTSSLKTTSISDSLWLKASGTIEPRYILQSTDNDGNAAWVPLTTIPDYSPHPTPYKEATVTGGGTILPLATWNLTTATGIRYIDGMEIKLTPGVWMVFFSVVVEPLPVASATASDPIWTRFYLARYTGTYSEPSTSAGAAVQRLSALDISDRAYANVSKNVIKGYVVVRINGSEQTLRPCINTRSAASGYAAWPTGTVTEVKIGDSADPQNYMIAFPM